MKKKKIMEINHNRSLKQKEQEDEDAGGVIKEGRRSLEQEVEEDEDYKEKRDRWARGDWGELEEAKG